MLAPAPQYPEVFCSKALKLEEIAN
jgi:hypothetical protein